MLLEATDLDVRFGRTHALKSVSLHVEAGEIVTVLGANGAGKTTLLRALQGAVILQGGHIRFDGRSIAGLGPSTRVKNGLSLVPEGRQIFVSMTIEENLLIGAHLRKDKDVARDIDKIYERFPNLASRRAMPARVLSGGEQQMLAIGRALVSRPRLMMLDEPSLGLSPLFVERLFDLLRELNRDGLAILLVEQNTQMALDLAARGYVLERGTVVMKDQAQALMQNPALAAAYLGMEEAAAP